jgi:hypothetical protein
MQTENTPAKRTYSTGPNSKRQKIIRYFKENPDASPAVVAKKFDYAPSATHSCKRIARAAMKGTDVGTNGTFKNGSGWSEGLMTALAPKSATMSVVAQVNTLAAQRWGGVAPDLQARIEPVTPPPSLFSWADYSLWMDREQMRGFLRGRAVEYLTKGDKLSIEEALRCVTKLSELTD